jgi:hypothetical protein
LEFALDRFDAVEDCTESRIGDCGVARDFRGLGFHANASST